MAELVEASWRIYPALALAVLGAALAAGGVRLGADGFRRPVQDPAKAVTVMRGFRRLVIGLALAGVGVAWIWGLAWLLAVSLVIGAGETFESSLDIFALERGRRLRAGRREGGPPS